MTQRTLFSEQPPEQKRPEIVLSRHDNAPDAIQAAKTAFDSGKYDDRKITVRPLVDLKRWLVVIE